MLKTYPRNPFKSFHPCLVLRMPLLLCAATEFEITETRQFIQQQQLQNKISILISGVGLMAAAYALTKAVYTQKPSFILQAGVAGSFSEAFPLASVAVVKEEVVGDSGVEENGKFLSLFDMNLADGNVLPWQKSRLINTNKVVNECGLPIANAITVNEITTTENRIHFYRTSINTNLESLEGAALHYIALTENIPFMQLRAVSNFAGERDKKKWALGTSIAALNNALQQQLLKLI